MVYKISTKRMYSWQQNFIDNMKLYNILVAPRQHGKTELVAALIMSIALDPTIKNPVINLCSDTRKRIRAIYLDRFNTMFGHFPTYSWTNDESPEIVVVRSQDQNDYFTIKLWGSVRNKKGADGTTSHLNIVDECGYVSRAFIKESLMPTADHTGGSTILLGTVDPGDYFDIYKEAQKSIRDLGDKSPWFTMSFKIGSEWSRECRTQKQIDNIKARYNMNKLEDVISYKKMYLCDWYAGLSGNPLAASYEKCYNTGRIGRFPVDSNNPVGTCWDNGLGFKAVWFWQMVHGQPRFVGFKLWKDKSLQDACQEILEWYRINNAVQGRHIFPHTMRIREESDGVRLSRKTMKYLNHGSDNRGDFVCNRRVGNIDRKIETTSSVMLSCLFDEDACFEGLRSLLKYSRVENKIHKTRSKNIVKDDFSHGAEAFGEFCIAWEKESIINKFNEETNISTDQRLMLDLEKRELIHKRGVHGFRSILGKY